MASSPLTTGASRNETVDTCFAHRAAFAVGAVFLLVGIAGFVPGLTSNLEDLTWAGHHSEAELLGIFQVSVLHNLVHLAFGVAGMAAARHLRWSVWYLLGGGAIYLLLAVYGMVIEQDSDANFVPVNDADDWLHVGLGFAMIALGAYGQRDADLRSTRRGAGGTATSRETREPREARLTRDTPPLR